MSIIVQFVNKIVINKKEKKKNKNREIKYTFNTMPVN